jgi:hypothetical protein
VGRVFYLPVLDRERTPEEDERIDAATEWLLNELSGPVSLAALRGLAEKELARPRDPTHRLWAETFLAETKPPRIVRTRSEPIDEYYVAAAVRSLRDQGFPPTEGYYLVVLTPLEAHELVYRLGRTEPKRAHAHPPQALTETARNMGYEVVCVLGDALVVRSDHARVGAPRRSSGAGRHRRHLRLV